MHFIETYWFIWLLSMVIFGGLMIHNAFNDFGLMATFAVLAYLSTATLFLSIILNVISYAKM